MTYGRRGQLVVERNEAAVDRALAELRRGDGARDTLGDSESSRRCSTGSIGAETTRRSSTG